MSGMYASRWAATPSPSPAPAQDKPQEAAATPAEEPANAEDDGTAEKEVEVEKTLPTEPVAEEVEEKTDGWSETSKKAEASHADQEERKESAAVSDERPEPREESQIQVNAGAETDTDNVEDQPVIGAEDKPEELPVSNERGATEALDTHDEHTSVSKEVDDAPAVGSPVKETPASPVNLNPQFLMPPRLKTRVSWRDKRSLAICIPDVDFKAVGLPIPLTFEEAAARIKEFEDAGYNTRGFDVDQDTSEGYTVAHVKPIFPDENELRKQFTQADRKVTLPDRAKWAAYMDWLMEQKLAALGVQTAPEEPVGFPVSSIASQDLSRASSAVYPPLPFSPPIPGSSASSVSRPGVTRGHSHNMSVASPLSPVGGAFGHMHRHSVFNGLPPLPFPQMAGQQPQGFMGPRTFSPIQQVPSPGQLNAMRSEMGFVRTASPHQPQIPSPSPMDPGRSLIEEHIRRQSVQITPAMNPFFQPNTNFQPTGTLPQLPEEDDEDELKDPEPEPEPEDDEDEGPSTPVYVPPQKRGQFNGEIAVPTPRGHRHNISEGLERDILAAESRKDVGKFSWADQQETSNESDEGATKEAEPQPIETDPLGSNIEVRERQTKHSHKKSTTTRFNANAPTFQFNPEANFQPASTAFTFAAPKPATNGTSDKGHIRQTSSGTFNVAAPVFQPSSFQPVQPPIQNFQFGQASSNEPKSGFQFGQKVADEAKSSFQFGEVQKGVPKSDFNFSTQGPSFRPGAIFEPPPPSHKTSVDGLPSIFGKVEIPEIVKPPRRSKAITIVRPEDAVKSASGTDVEDSEGRIAQSEDRLKRARKQDGDGDEVPRFAEPSPLSGLATFTPTVLPSNSTPKLQKAAVAAPETNERESIADEDAETIEASVDETRSPAEKPATNGWRKGHKSSGSLSALAKPFQPAFFQPVDQSTTARSFHAQRDSIKELEDGEIEDDHPATSPVRPIEPDAQRSDFIPPNHEHISTEDIDRTLDVDPSFAEIDAVMQQLNELEDSTETTGRNRSYSPLPPSPGSHPLKGVTYLPAEPWNRSDAPSPSPKRAPVPPKHKSSHLANNRTDSPEPAAWPPVNRLNRAEDQHISDWSDVISPPEEEKFTQRSNFFDRRIDEIIGRVVERRLQPLEDSLRSIEYTVSKRARSIGGRSTDQHSLKRSESTVLESDADDEDDNEGDVRRRPISRGRDKKVDQIKLAVLEALREEGPRREQPDADFAELQAVLADMKMSFARAAGSGLDLEDIKAIVEQSVSKHNESVRVAVEQTVSQQSDAVRTLVEESVSKQAQAAAQSKDEESQKKREAAHRRELSELEGRLNETLAGALEEANRRRAAEEREIEAKRQLRLSEEELKLMRDTSRDGDSRVNALAGERRELLDRAQQAEAKNEAMEVERKRLLEHADQVASKLNDLEVERDDLRKRLEAAEQSKHKAEEHSKTLSKENAVMQETLDEYRKSSASWRQHIDDAKEARVHLEATIEQLRADLASSKRESAGLEKFVESVRLEADAAKKDNEALEKQYVEVEQNFEIARTANEELETLVATLRHSAEEATRQKDDLEWTISNLQQNLGDGKRQRVEYDVNVTALRSELEDVKREKTEQQVELQNTIDELRRDLNEVKSENEDLENAIAGLERQLEEGQEASDAMKRRLEKLHADMSTAAGQLASEKATWKAKEEDARQWREALEAQHAADARERYALDEEVRTLRAAASEAIEAKANLEQLRLTNISLDEIVRKLQGDLVEQQSIAARFEREYHDLKEAGRSELLRSRMSLETDLETANHQMNMMRAQLETELNRARNEIDTLRQEADIVKARQERMLEDEEQARREALRKVNHANSIALDEARQRHDSALKELAAQHQRALDHAIEDKGRSEAFLMERLTLSEEKVKHYKDRVEHLEERLEVTKVAAQAAANKAQKAGPREQTRGMPSFSYSSSGLPEKISPQALRESILVLQEQLQDREVQIDKLRNQVDHEGPAKLKERDTEINWLRELLTVRSEELGELVNALSEPDFDQDGVRDAAIRIRANLDMQLQERARLGQSSSASLPEQALASLSSFATPRLSSAFSKWRSAMENPNLKQPARKSMTPSRRPPPVRQPPSYMSGLMTPPASNLRDTPSPEATSSLPPPRLQSRKESTQSARRPSNLSIRRPSNQSSQSVRRPSSSQNRPWDGATPKARQASTSSTGSAARLFREQNYDGDAEDRNVHLPTFEEDEDLDVQGEAAPPGFRSLEDELDEPSDSGAVEGSELED